MNSSDTSGTGKAARGTVRAVSRALQILDAFRSDEQGVSLSELSRRLGMGKTTVLRTARTLAQSGYLAQRDDGHWRLGSASGSLGVRYQASFDVGDAVDLVLRWLTDTTGETTALFAHEGSVRTCVARIEKASLMRHHIRVGEHLPLNHGASGHVLSAFSWRAGAFYEKIRRRGYYVSVGERDSLFSSISVPVFGPGQCLFGALCISGMAEELRREALVGYLDVLVEAATRLSRTLAKVPARGGTRAIVMCASRQHPSR